ncbi:MAG: transposase domain-containing protein [Solobacterium sp.]|nr:transposase domain-containing protein [Solobacterium sp.]
MTLVETAKANDADPYWYIQYLLEKMPSRYYSGREYQDLDQMVPWSEEFHRYEEEQKRKMLDRTAPPGNEKPKTPRKKDRAIIIYSGLGSGAGAYARCQRTGSSDLHSL